MPDCSSKLDSDGNGVACE
ncbi:excalibur calcium-binding domain-containing protein [Rhodococcus sp. NPDC049939]